MAFDVTGLLVFRLAILPGFVAQQSRYSITPRSVQQKTAIEETGEYVLNSIFIHAFLLMALKLFLSVSDASALPILDNAIRQKKLLEWSWEHHYFVLFYYLVSLILGICFGILRGTLVLNQPVRSLLLRRPRIERLLASMRIFLFLQEEPVWYDALRQRSVDKLTFVEVKMKESGGFYTGELKNFAILPDSERQKDFYLVNVYFRKPEENKYTRLDLDGILLNFADAESIKVIKSRTPATAELESPS
jgi:hypothetical protein